MKYKTEYSHTLISPVAYAAGGVEGTAKTIVVPAPCNLQYASLAVLEQEQAKAVFKAAVTLKDSLNPEKTTPVVEAEASDVDAEQHVGLLAGNGFDLAAARNSLKQLLAFGPNAGKLDGKEKMTETLFESMSVVDTRILLGKYLLNFLNFSRPN